MQARNLQLQDVADYCRKDRQTVSNWCNIELGAATRIPRLAMKDLCEYLSIHPSEILTDTSGLVSHISSNNRAVYTASL